jgi:hypothetical protein
MIDTCRCKTLWQVAQERAREWRKAWPAHCTRCHGDGSVGRGQESEDCACISEGACPRCGTYGLDVDKEVSCQECGWDWGNNLDDGMPDPEVVCPH